MDLDEVRGALTQKVAFEQRPEEREGGSALWLSGRRALQAEGTASAKPWSKRVPEF